MRTTALLLAAALAAAAGPAAAFDPARVDAASAARPDPARIDRARELRHAQALLRRAERLGRALEAGERAGRAPSRDEYRRSLELLDRTDRVLHPHWDRLDPQTRERYRAAWTQAERLHREGQRMAAQPEVKAAIGSARELLLALIRDLRNGLHAGIERAAERSR